MMQIPLQPKEFVTGLALFCVVPTTLGVGVALTAASKGNQALALLLTVGDTRAPDCCLWCMVRLAGTATGRVTFPTSLHMP